jgi:8-amino-7-oxononanoate synthase
MNAMQPDQPGASPTITRSWAAWVDDQCRIISDAGQWRGIRTVDAHGPNGVLVDLAKPVVSFASNDYLGLTQHPAVKAAAIEAIERWGTGSGASRLVVGSRPIHDDLEARLAEWRGVEAAVLFPTGYAANTGLLAVLGQRGARICSDELNHASIVDGCRMARANGADVRVYPHADVDAIAHELQGAERAVVVTDTVFSMDGDVAPLADIAELCVRSKALLVVDDAHKVFPITDLDDGAFGPMVVRVGTLSKTLGSLGGFVAASRPIVDLVINRARPFIFTTAPSPADAAAASAALDIATSAEGDQLLTRLRAHIDAMRSGHTTPIIPIVMGDERAAMIASAQLLEQGLLVPAIRPPTVAPGTSRLRVALSAAHTADQVARLSRALPALP